MYSYIKKTSLFLLIIFIILSGIFAYLWYQEKTRTSIPSFVPLTKESYLSLPMDQRDSLEGIIKKDYFNRLSIKYRYSTEPIDTGDANAMYRYYQANSSYYIALGRKKGLRFDIGKLISFFNYWQNNLGADKVDIRFAKYLPTFPYPGLRDKFTLILYPLRGVADINPAPGVNESLPLNLGDLYP